MRIESNAPWWTMCFHLHLYQPRRKNPKTGEMPMEYGAEPFRDWTSKATGWCYAPLGRMDVCGVRGECRRTLNLYEYVSFNVGPTLMTYLMEYAPDVVENMRKGNNAAIERLGHPAAIAQPYTHMILPLATSAQRRLEIRWGIKAYRQFFGCEPEGMWLPECAVNTDTLEALAENGIKFTILAPSQAKANVDSKRPYTVRLPSGRSIGVFFYNGQLSNEVAFGQLAANGDKFYDRLAAEFRWEPFRQMVHIGNDAETYGLHQAFHGMGLAQAVNRALHADGIALLNYGAFLQSCSDRFGVEIWDNSSWSCVHGIDRWYRHCGCRDGRDNYPSQEWRTPFFAAQQLVREGAVRVYARNAYRYFLDPAKALEDYVYVDMNSWSGQQLLALHGKAHLNQSERIRALNLLKMMLHAEFGLTSCGTFFNELSSLEPTHCMLESGYAAELAEEFEDGGLLEQYLGALQAARSNVSEYGTGRNIYDMWIRPQLEDVRSEFAAA